MSKPGAVKAIVLVGGPSVGTRFRPLSLDCPKPLFPIAGFPMIYHHIQAFAKVPDLREVLLIGFFENSVFAELIQRAQREFPHLSVRYLQEYRALGTGGGLYHFRDEIMAGSPSLFFVINADIACSFPLQQMLQFHRTNNPDALCTLASIRVARARAPKYGCIVSDSATHEVLHYVEKPTAFLSDTISTGIFLFSTRLFALLKQIIEAPPSGARLGSADDDDADAEPAASGRKEKRLRLEQDVLRRLAGNERLMFTYAMDPEHDFWMQVKTAAAALAANRHYLDEQQLRHDPALADESTPVSSPVERRGPSPLNAMLAAAASGAARQRPTIIGSVRIDPTAIVDPSARIGPNVTIGARVVVERGVRVRDAILLDDVHVHHSACVIRAVIGWQSVIGCWARVEGVEPPATDDVDTDGHTVRGCKVPGAAILGKQVVLQDECILRSCVVLPHKELKSSYHNEILM